MAKTTLADTPTEELHSKLKAINAIQNTVLGIFFVIILAWIVLGYWRTNLPVFISTVAMGIAIAAMQAATRSSLQAELRKRGAA
jgi:hypothetical protein